MLESASVVVKHDGVPVQLRFDACRIYLGGEFSGNVELDIACDPNVLPALVECLRLQLPGSPASELSIAHGDYARGVGLVFHSEALSEPPDELGLLWGDASIASVAPILADSVPIETRHELVDPLQILKTMPAPATGPVRLAANREAWWILLSALFVSVGALVAASVDGLVLPRPEINPPLGFALILLGLGVAVLGTLMPTRQIWLDREHRRVLVIEGRAWSPEARFVDAPGRAVDEFAHVRVHEQFRSSGDIDDDGQRTYYVELEGPMRFASEDGCVHVRTDALRVGSFASSWGARRQAALVGFHMGLRILDTDDQTC